MVRAASHTRKKAKPKECRFVVQSAQEAVRKVREELGPNARVISVKQVKGTGLQRFLATPKLEIVARLEEPPKPEPVSVQEQAQPIAKIPSNEAQEPKAQITSEAPPVITSAPEPMAVTPRSQGPDLTCRKFLMKAGFSDELLSRFEGGSYWRDVSAMDLREGLPLAVKGLREQLAKLEKRELPNKLAFLGGPGAGKTTSLCKLLAREVFINGKHPQVLRLEVDKPHLDDGLVMYCEVLGLKCTRLVDEIDLADERGVIVDIPGYSLRDTGEQDRVKEQLDALGIDGRVLVMNAAYEESVLRRFLDSGQRLGAQFQILTHLDELDEIGKLWHYLYDLERTLLFFSNGQNIAGDRIDDPFGYLLDRTFPR